MMKKYIFYLLIALVTLSIQAKERTEAERMQIIQEHFSNRISAATRSTNEIKLVGVSSQITNIPATRTSKEAFFIYNYGKTAFIIVSGDDSMQPVLGYSESGNFVMENMPENLKNWLSLYALPLKKEAMEEAQSLGKLNKAQTSVIEYPTSVTPLLGNIAWNQDAPYNAFCPEQSVTGCVATAMSMIMKYYNYPKIGKGRHTYISSPHSYSCSYDFEEKPFQWSNMLPEYINGDYTETQKNAVAELMYACGVSVDMKYDPFSSAASALSVSQALVTYFKYDANMQFRLRDAYTNVEWMDMIMKELSEKRPILYNGASKEVGHEFVLDGYDEHGMVHINWGWGGLSNGYFEVSTLNPLNPGIGGGSGQSGGYTYSQGMIVGLQPATNFSEPSHSWFMTAMTLLEESREFSNKETISIGLANIVNYGTTFNGEMGIALSEIKGEIKNILVKRNVSGIVAGQGGNLQFDFKISEEITDGDYYLHAVAKTFRGDKWETIRPIQGYTPYYILRVKDGNLTIYDPRQKPNLSGNYNVAAPLTVNKYGDFSVTVKNEGKEYYYGYAGVLITPDITSDQNCLVLDIVSLSPGEERTINIRKAMVNSPDNGFYIAPGSAKICGVYTFGEVLLPLTQFKDIEIADSPLTHLTLIGQLATAKPVFEVGEEFVLPVRLQCEGQYDQYLVAAIFPYGATVTNIQVVKKVSLEDGQQYDLELRGYPIPELKEGKYLVGLYYYDLATSSYSGELGFTTFDVSEATAIQSITNDNSLFIYPTVVADFLNIRCDERVKQIKILSMTGSVLNEKRVGVEPGILFNVPVHDLAAGSYILLIQTDNNTYAKKILKE